MDKSKKTLGSGPSANAIGAADDYDPHLHRTTEKPTNNTETLIHLVKCCLGTGILALPQSYSNAGLITGILGTCMAAAIVTHALHIFVGAQYVICKQKRVPLLTFPDSVGAGVSMGPAYLRPYARACAYAVDIFLLVYQLGVCCVYILFIAENIKKAFDSYTDMSLGYYFAIILIPLLLFNLIPNLKILVPFSLFANFLSLVSIIIVFYYLNTGSKAQGEKTVYWGPITSYPLFFGTVLFSLTPTGVVIALENNMADPKAFLKPFGVLNTGLFILVALYTVFGSFGYLYCKSGCSDSITLDLPKGTLVNVTLLLYAMAIFISYGLHSFVPVEVIFRLFCLPRLTRNNASTKRIRTAQYILRIAVCLGTFILAVSVPRLGLFISLFGALCTSALSLIFPGLVDICIRHPSNYGSGRIILYKDIGIIIVGIFGLIVGTYAAFRGLIMSFQ